MNILRYVGRWFVGLIREVGGTQPLSVPKMPEEPDMRDEYDLSSGGVRGKYVEAYKKNLTK